MAKAVSLALVLACCATRKLPNELRCGSPGREFMRLHCVALSRLNITKILDTCLSFFFHSAVAALQTLPPCTAANFAAYQTPCTLNATSGVFTRSLVYYQNSSCCANWSVYRPFLHMILAETSQR